MHDQKHCDKLKKATIAKCKMLVEKKPNEYDSSKLDECIKFINSLDADNIDATLILEKHIKIIQKPIYKWTSDEKDKILNLFNDLGYAIDATVDMNKEKDNTRDDLAWRIKKNDQTIVVWVNKSRPYFHDGLYNILCINLNFCNSNFVDFDDMLTRLKYYIENED